MTSCSLMLAIAIGFSLFGTALSAYHDFQLSTSLSSLLEQGLGKISLASLIRGPFVSCSNLYGAAQIWHVLFANMFQLLISFEYLFYNSILTCQGPILHREESFTSIFSKKRDIALFLFPLTPVEVRWSINACARYTSLACVLECFHSIDLMLWSRSERPTHTIQRCFKGGLLSSWHSAHYSTRYIAARCITRAQHISLIPQCTRRLPTHGSQ